MSYHNGSVWPHDNALIAAGLARYGHRAEAARITEGLIDAAQAFDWRLPELFCGFDRSEFPAPVPYPTSCSPQAWAAAAPIQLLRTLLDLEPGVASEGLTLDPWLPPSMTPLELLGVTFADDTFAVRVDGGTPRVSRLQIEHAARGART